MKLEDIQTWQKNFAKSKGAPQDAKDGLNFAVLKLSEEVGEVSRGILKSDWENVQEECFDVISFICKISNIVEEAYGTKTLTEAMLAKMKLVEERGKLDPKTHRAKRTTSEIVKGK